jgi:signal transduction histidine kinase
MHSEREQKIKNMIWKELALKGTSASFVFFSFALMMFFYYFQVKTFKNWIQFFCLIAMLSNAARLLLARSIVHEPMISVDKINIIRICIWINTLCWGAIFGLSLIELGYSNYHSGILLMMTAGFSAGSIVTLGHDKSVFIPFQVFLLVPLAANFIHQWLTGSNPSANYLVLFCAIFIIYQIKQQRIYETNLKQRFNYQLDLEKTLEEVKKAQETLVSQTASLLHASKINALGEMAGGLSHEVNNSLQVILASTQGVHKEIKKSGIDSPSIESKLSHGLSAILKIKSVIDGLKHFSQEMDRVEKERVSLPGIFEKVFVYTNELLKAHRIELRISDIPDFKIFCQPFQITQIIFNIIKNADDVLKHDSSPEKWISVKFEETKDFIMILISNSGPLIKHEHQERLFQPFFSTKDLNSGTGLSLSISKGMALEHKGDLFFKPQERFTTFVLKLPKMP